MNPPKDEDVEAVKWTALILASWSLACRRRWGSLRWLVGEADSMPSMHRRERRCGPSPPILSSIPPPQSPTGESILAQMTTNCMRFTCLAHH